MGAIANSARRSRRALVLIITMISASALIAAGCRGDDDGGSGGSSSGGDGDVSTYNIAIVSDLTGGASCCGPGVAAGAQTYLAQVEDEGDLAFNVDVFDSGTSTEAAGPAVRQALDTNPIAIVGGPANFGSSAAAPLVGPEGITYVHPAFDPSVAGEPWYFALSNSSGEALSAYTQYMEEELGGVDGKRLALVGVDTPGFDELIELFRDSEGESGYSVVATEATEISAPSFQVGAANVASADPDVVVVYATPQDAVTYATALNEAGVDVPILSPPCCNGPEVLERINSDSYQGFWLNPIPEDGSPIDEAARQHGFGNETDSSFFTMGWSGAAVIVEGLRACGDGCDVDGLREAVSGLSDVQPPNDATYGPLDPSKQSETESMVTTVQFVKWDGPTSAVVTVGDTIDVSSVG